MFAIYRGKTESGVTEVIVTTTKREETMLKEMFGLTNNRNRERYDRRTSEKSSVVVWFEDV